MLLQLVSCIYSIESMHHNCAAEVTAAAAAAADDEWEGRCM
jgi:hypothetical protein